MPAKTLAALLLFALPCCAADMPEYLEQPLAVFMQNQPAEALPLFQQAVQEHPKEAWAHAWLAETYRRLERTELAISTARHALQLDPKNSFAHTVLAGCMRVPATDPPRSDSCWVHLQAACGTIRATATPG